MSASYPARSVVRCPLCYEHRQPAHVGQAVMVCEGCGNTFRVVSGKPGKTGAKLGAMIRQVVRWR